MITRRESDGERGGISYCLSGLAPMHAGTKSDLSPRIAEPTSPISTPSGSSFVFSPPVVTPALPLGVSYFTRRERSVERYLSDKKPEWSESTHYYNSSALNRFPEFSEDNGLVNICEVDGFHISDFKAVRREEGINETTLLNDLCSLRTFLKWCSSMGLVESWVVEDMVLNDPDDRVRSEKIDLEEAEMVLNYLEQFEYSTMRHALFALLWDTGIRIGTARGLDVSDYNPEENFIEVHHRPDEETPLKN